MGCAHEGDGSSDPCIPSPDLTGDNSEWLIDYKTPQWPLRPTTRSPCRYSCLIRTKRKASAHISQQISKNAHLSLTCRWTNSKIYNVYIRCIKRDKLYLFNSSVQELAKQIDEYTATYGPDDQLEWSLVLGEIRAFIEVSILFYQLLNYWTFICPVVNLEWCPSWFMEA